jgi:transposase
MWKRDGGRLRAPDTSDMRGSSLRGVDTAVATIGCTREFKQGRQLATWLGLGPTQHFSDGHARVGEISCRGEADCARC